MNDRSSSFTLDQKPTKPLYCSIPRRGAAVVLIIIMMMSFVILAAFTVDYAYMQLIRTELRIATDAASKAGAEALARTEDVDLAKQAAVNYASLNTVGGESFQISLNDVTLGRLADGNGNDIGNGRRSFVANGFPYNAVRVDSKTGGSASNPAVPLFFGSVLGVTSFAPSQTATAGQQQLEVCLCLDRSGSMLFDMSGNDFVYPPNNPLLSNFTAWGSVWRNHLSPPHPTLSRWAVLNNAVQLFLDKAGESNSPPRTSLVTWGTNYQMPIAPFTNFLAATTDVNLPAQAQMSWTANRAVVTAGIHQLSNKPMMGGTNISAGIDRAVSVLTGNTAGTLSSKAIVLFTDGMWNDGRSPIQAAQDAQAQGIAIHIVTMLTAVQPDLQQAAALTGGRYYNASNAAEIEDAFREIAKSLEIVLID